MLMFCPCAFTLVILAMPMAALHRRFGTHAPFVGLFGTVWGVYHALITIGMTGSGGALDQVAGPVGEALIMTGIGLAVAIPVVLGYNDLVRSNCVTLAKLSRMTCSRLSVPVSRCWRR